MKGRHIFKNESFLGIHNKYKKFKSENIEVENIYEIIKKEYIQKIKNNEFNFIFRENLFKNKDWLEFGRRYKSYFKYVSRY